MTVVLISLCVANRDMPYILLGYMHKIRDECLTCHRKKVNDTYDSLGIMKLLQTPTDALRTGRSHIQCFVELSKSVKVKRRERERERERESV